MFTGRPHLADRLKDLLHQQVLIRNKGIVVDKLDVVGVVGQLGGGTGIECQLVAQYVALVHKELGQLIFGQLVLFQQTLLDNFVGIGGRE